MTKRGIVRERILRVLLNHPGGSLTKYRLAKEAESSFPWLHEFLGKLEEMELVEDTTVIDYAELIEYWGSVKSKPQHKEYMHRDPLRMLEEIKLPYAITTYQADNLLQHFLFPSRTDIYIMQNDLKKWHKRITKEGLVGQGNVRLLLGDEHVYYNLLPMKHFNIVSLPQLIVDLLDEGGVCAESAHMLLKRRKKLAV